MSRSARSSSVQLELELETGSFGSISPRFDIGGPLFGYGALQADGKNPPTYSDRGVRYRLVGLYNYDEGFRDYFDANHRFYLAPSVTIDFSAGTSLTLLADLTYDNNFADFGIGLGAQGDIVAPVGRVNNHPQDRLDRRNYIVGYDFRHELGRGWTVENRLRYIDSGYEYSAILLPLSFDATTGIYERAPAFQFQNNEEIATQLNFSGDHEIGRFRNRLFAGFDFRFSTVENFTRFDPVNLFRSIITARTTQSFRRRSIASRFSPAAIRTTRSLATAFICRITSTSPRT